MSKWAVSALFAVLWLGLALPLAAAPCAKGSPDTCTIIIERHGKPTPMTLREFRQSQQQELRQLQDQNASERTGASQALRDLMQQDRDRSDQAATGQRQQEAQQRAQAAARRQACLSACALPATCEPAPVSVPPGIPLSTYCSSNRAQCQVACH
jgi:hypothetical protein